MKNRSLLDSFHNALAGVLNTLKEERNFRIHFACGMAALVLSVLLDITIIEFLVIVVAIVLVLITELINTAIEACVDICSPEIHPLAKKAKDAAAGAVFLTASLAAAVGFFIFYVKISQSGFSFAQIGKIKRDPVYLTAVCVFIALMFTIVMKAFFKSKHFFHGGVISSHSAIAFSLATSIALVIDDVAASSIIFILALLVAQSRVEGGIHSVLEVVLGALLGVGIPLILFMV